MRRFDVGIAGLGGMGTAAAFHVASRGRSVCCLDPFPVGHARGSSHGQTRLIRLAYYEHPDYVPLLLRAWELWRDLEHRGGHRLLDQSGLVMAGPSDGDVIVGAALAADRHRLGIERLSAAEACRRWPQLHLPASWSAIHEPRAGFLRVEDCVAAHAAAGRAAGATFEIGTALRAWRTDGRGVVVTTDRGDIGAERLILAPGAWASGLMKFPQAPLVVLRKSLFWCRPDTNAGAAFAPGTCPCFAFDTPAGFFYGFPALDDRGVKIAEHSGGRVAGDPLAVDRSVDAAEQASIAAFAAEHLPRLGATFSGHAVCLYTMSPDRHFLLGLHPDHDQVAIAAGFSGHGFKFATVVGEILADLATAGTTTLPIDFLSPRRFC